MNPNEGPAGKIIEALQERAKELHCLYNVHELVNRPDATIEEVCRDLLVILPPGWQYPDVCYARVTLNGIIYEPPGFTTTP